MTLGISRKSINKIKKDDSAEPTTSLTKTDRSQAKRKHTAKVDSFDIYVIRTAVTELIQDNKTISLKSLCAYLKDKKGINVSKFVLWKNLHKLGFKYGRVERNTMGLLERPDIVKKRISYLRSIQRYREARRPIVYLDETWVDTNCYPRFQWLAPEGAPQRKLPASRGQRFVILHAGNKKGFLDGCHLVFQVNNFLQS